MESIDRLRKYVAEHTDYSEQYGVYCTTTINDLIDAIEREVEEKYVELPKDADGVTTAPSDNMVDRNGEQFVVSSIELLANGEWLLYGNGKLGNELATRCRHHKPPTVEDLLEEYRVKYYDLVTDMECKNITNEEYVQGIKELASEFSAKLQIRKED